MPRGLLQGLRKLPPLLQPDVGGPRLPQAVAVLLPGGSLQDPPEPRERVESHWQPAGCLKLTASWLPWAFALAR
jgi:hypothetical protein